MTSETVQSHILIQKLCKWRNVILCTIVVTTQACVWLLKTSVNPDYLDLEEVTTDYYRGQKMPTCCIQNTVVVAVCSKFS
jgi:hypothetical protein